MMVKPAILYQAFCQVNPQLMEQPERRKRHFRSWVRTGGAQRFWKQYQKACSKYPVGSWKVKVGGKHEAPDVRLLDNQSGSDIVVAWYRVSAANPQDASIPTDDDQRFFTSIRNGEQPKLIRVPKHQEGYHRDLVVARGDSPLPVSFDKQLPYPVLFKDYTCNYQRIPNAATWRWGSHSWTARTIRPFSCVYPQTTAIGRKRIIDMQRLDKNALVGTHAFYQTE